MTQISYKLCYNRCATVGDGFSCLPLGTLPCRVIITMNELTCFSWRLAEAAAQSADLTQVELAHEQVARVCCARLRRVSDRPANCRCWRALEVPEAQITMRMARDFAERLGLVPAAWGVRRATYSIAPDNLPANLPPLGERRTWLRWIGC